jgi:hemoglobin-like flavoprotein
VPLCQGPAVQICATCATDALCAIKRQIVGEERPKTMKEFLAENRPSVPPEITEAWDRWYASLPPTLKRRCAFHDFKLIGALFKEAFGIP